MVTYNDILYSAIVWNVCCSIQQTLFTHHGPNTSDGNISQTPNVQGKGDKLSMLFQIIIGKKTQHKLKIDSKTMAPTGITDSIVTVANGEYLW